MASSTSDQDDGLAPFTFIRSGRDRDSEGLQQKINRYPRMVTNAKNIFTAATKKWEGLVSGCHLLKYVETAVIKNKVFSIKF